MFHTYFPSVTARPAAAQTSAPPMPSTQVDDWLRTSFGSSSVAGRAHRGPTPAAAAVPQATAEAKDPAVVPRSLQTPAQRTATYLQNLVGQGRDLGIRLPSPPYFAFNADKPTLVQNACDQVVATSDAPLSKPAAAWIKKMQVANGDGWNKVTRDFESRRMEVLWQTGAGRGRQSALRPPTPQNTACPPHLNLPFPPQQPLPRPLGRPSCFSASAS